jgi:hypothetical protein
MNVDGEDGQDNMLLKIVSSWELCRTERDRWGCSNKLISFTIVNIVINSLLVPMRESKQRNERQKCNQSNHPYQSKSNNNHHQRIVDLIKKGIKGIRD